MIEFRVTNRHIMLDYRPEDRGGAWLVARLKLGNARLSKVFYFSKDDLVGELREWDEESAEEQDFTFRFASKADSYYRIPGRILIFRTMSSSRLPISR